MIDRIEELLGLLAAEDEEEREDGFTLSVTEESVPAFPREDEEAGDGGTGDRSGERTAGESGPDRLEPIAGELWKGGPVWTVRGTGPETDGVQKIAAVKRTARTEEAVLPSGDEEPVWAGLERAARSGAEGLALEGAGRSGLAGLYRQTVQGLRPAAPALPSEQAGRTVRAQEPGSAASLAVDELDRAVRRDSRRYDGGMSIY